MGSKTQQLLTLFLQNEAIYCINTEKGLKRKRIHSVDLWKNVGKFGENPCQY